MSNHSFRQATALVAVAVAREPVASARTLKRVSHHPTPRPALENFDVSFGDQTTSRDYLADRSSDSLDILDAAAGTSLGPRLPGHQRLTQANVWVG